LNIVNSLDTLFITNTYASNTTTYRYLQEATGKYA